VSRENPPVDHLSRRADRDLLRRLGAESDTRDTSSAPRNSTAPRFRNRESGEAGVPRRDPKSERRWLSELAERTGRQLADAGAEPSSRVRDESSVQWPAPNVQSLEEQWSSPITGPDAPAGLLARLANDAQPDSSATDRTSEDRFRKKGPTPVQRRSSSDPSSPSVVGRENEASNGGASERSSPAASQPAGWGTWLPDTPSALDEVGASQAGTSTSIASPIESQTLPAMRPREARFMLEFPVAATMPPRDAPLIRELPVAASMIRRGARIEERPEEDLGELSDKIRRILEEEARRHGIDV
jgi:hypothetical protein